MTKNRGSFEIQGHRGCRGLMPENTIEAFKKAIDLGVETLELDVVLSKDHKVVVSHEPQFNPEITTKPDGSFFNSLAESNLYKMDYDEIKKYDVGLKFYPEFPRQMKIASCKPLLSEVFREVSTYIKFTGRTSIKYNIEIKSLPEEYNLTQPEVKEFVDKVIEVIEKDNSSKSFTLQSFDYNVLKYLNHLNQKGKNYVLAVLIEPEDNNEIEFNIEKLGFKPDIWSPYFKKLDFDFVQNLHDKGIRVIPWTVNTEKEMDRVFDFGCDGLITDYPDKAFKFITK